MIKKLISAGLISCSLFFTGCWIEAAVPAITAIAAVIGDAHAVLNIIQNSTNSWFQHKPNPELQAQANELINRTWEALRVATNATNGAEDLTQKEYDEAFAEFKAAYLELHNFLNKIGVLKGNTLGSADGKDFREPLALGYKVRN